MTTETVWLVTTGGPYEGHSFEAVTRTWEDAVRFIAEVWEPRWRNGPPITDRHFEDDDLLLTLDYCFQGRQSRELFEVFELEITNFPIITREGNGEETDG